MPARNRGQVIPKGAKKWLVRVYNGRDPVTKKRQYVSRMIEGTYKQAEAKLTEMSHEQNTQTFMQPSKETLSEYFDRWLETRITMKDVAPKTVMNYKRLFKTHIKPVLGNVRLDQVTQASIQKLITNVAAAGKLRTAECIYTILKAALRQAVKWGILIRNPAAEMILPKREGSSEKKGPAIYTPEQCTTLFNHTAGTQWGTLWLLLLTTGLRPQEALALKWSDLDIAEGTLRVNRALGQVAPTKWEVMTTKTEKSRRVIALPQHTLTALAEHRRRQAVEILSAGEAYVRNDFIVTTRAGGFITPTFMREAWYRDVKKADLPKLRPYSARHSHVSHLLMAGVHPKVAAERAGHSTTHYTMETYTHVLPAVHKETAAMVDDLLFKKVGNQ